MGGRRLRSLLPLCRTLCVACCVLRAASMYATRRHVLHVARVACCTLVARWLQQELLPPQPQLSWKRQRAKLALLRVRDDASEIADRDGGTAVFIFVPPRS